MDQKLTEAVTVDAGSQQEGCPELQGRARAVREGRGGRRTHPEKCQDPLEGWRCISWWVGRGGRRPRWPRKDGADITKTEDPWEPGRDRQGQQRCLGETGRCLQVAGAQVAAGSCGCGRAGPGCPGDRIGGHSRGCGVLSSLSRPRLPSERAVAWGHHSGVTLH